MISESREASEIATFCGKSIQKLLMTENVREKNSFKDNANLSTSQTWWNSICVKLEA